MRRILIDLARAHDADKRGGDQVKVSLDDAMAVAADQSALLLQVDKAVDRLAAIDPRRARIVELRFFGGLPWKKPPKRWGSDLAPSTATGASRARGYDASWNLELTSPRLRRFRRARAESAA